MLGGWYWGYLLAAVTFQFVYPLFNETPDLAWRVMFWVAIVPALFTLWIRARVSESPIWLERQKQPRTTAPKLSIGRIFQRDMIGTTIHTTLVIGSFM
jgi:MFS family permease